MTSLLLGVLLWSLTHFFPATLPTQRQQLIGKLGKQPYRGVFTALMALSIYLIVSGWKATPPAVLYVAPDWGRLAATLLMLPAVLLFIAPYPPNNFKRLIRHPQLSGIVLWGLAHLLANGETRSFVLFAGLAAWALIEIVLINRREGDWDRPAVVTRKHDLLLLAGALVTYALVTASHGWLFGVPALVG